MIKAIIKDSITLLLANPKLIRVAFFMTFGHSIYYIYLITYFFNGSIKMKYEAGIDTSAALIYLFNTIQHLNIRWVIAAFIFIVLIGNFRIYPIGEASIIYYIKAEKRKLTSAIHQGLKKFFPMLEFQALGSFLGIYTIITITTRMRVMGILDNIIIKIILAIWIFLSLFTIFFRPYIKYYIVVHNLPVFDAFKKSVLLTIGNIGLTFKGVIFEMLLTLRFFINAGIMVGIPLGLIYIAVFFKIIDHTRVESLIRIIAGLLLLFVTYINGIFEAFFTSYRYKIFQEAEKNLEE
ncbi:MAG: hypothetical protein LBG52_03415 [Candidatus Peribacteria bacterium]|jgi:hypothetical protein|nr:hypothetical protein [Candidatus Peribacteria bacterium]